MSNDTYTGGAALIAAGIVPEVVELVKNFLE
jgi:hypothetical protein